MKFELRFIKICVVNCFQICNVIIHVAGVGFIVCEIFTDLFGRIGLVLRYLP